MDSEKGSLQSLGLGSSRSLGRGVRHLDIRHSDIESSLVVDVRRWYQPEEKKKLVIRYNPLLPFSAMTKAARPPFLPGRDFASNY